MFDGLGDNNCRDGFRDKAQQHAAGGSQPFSSLYIPGQMAAGSHRRCWPLNPMSRKLSWAFGAVAYFGAPFWAWLAIKSDYEAQIKCGTPMIGIMLLACSIAGLASLVALGLGVLSYRTVSATHSKMRVLEIAALSLPLLLAIVFAASILWA
jgi:hypothetical protein